jgi:hypothetical protein
MKVKATQEVHIRANEPWIKPGNKKGVLYPGFEVEVINVIYTNAQVINGNGTWYQDKNGDYLWSGGFSQINEPNTPPSSIKVHTDILANYPGNGNGIGIGILDSGFDIKNVFFKTRVQHYDSYLNNKDKSNIHPHGTKIAGIITSSDPSSKRNNSNIYCFRVLYANNFTDGSAVIEALKEIVRNTNLNKKIDLINMSLTVDEPYLPLMQTEIDTLRNEHGIVCVVAGGSSITKTGQLVLNKIANLQNVIRVCTFEKTDFEKVKARGIATNIHATFLNEPILTCSINEPSLNSEIGEDSAYTAFLTSVISRYLENRGIPKDKNRLSTIETYLDGLSEPISSDLIATPLKLYR